MTCKFDASLRIPLQLLRDWPSWGRKARRTFGGGLRRQTPPAAGPVVVYTFRESWVFIMIINWIEVSQFSVQTSKHNFLRGRARTALNVTELMNLETRKETNRLFRRSTGNRRVAPKLVFISPAYLFTCFQVLTYTSVIYIAVHIYSWLCGSWTLGLLSTD